MVMFSTVGLVLLVTALAVNVQVSIGQVSANLLYLQLDYTGRHECAVCCCRESFDMNVCGFITRPMSGTVSN